MDSLRPHDRIPHVLGRDRLRQSRVLVFVVAGPGLDTELTAVGMCFSHIRFSNTNMIGHGSQLGALGEEIGGELHGGLHVALDLHLALHEQGVGL